MAPAPETMRSLGSWSNFPNPELIIPEAFEEHPLRIPHQIAVVTGTALEKVLEVFDGMYGGGTDGQTAPCITTRDIVKYKRYPSGGGRA